MLALALLAACSDPPTRPPAAAPSVAADLAVLPPTRGSIRAVDLGVLPGDVASEATFVSEAGVVYGRSFRTLGGTPRFFRWTQAGGMVLVSSIPAAPVYPLPTITGPHPPFYTKVIPHVANAKGEATGELCLIECDSPARPSQNSSHVFRYSVGSGVVELDTRRWGDARGPGYTSHGLSINRWGHIAGEYWQVEGGDPQALFWTPVDSFRLVSEPIATAAQVNDIDQVVATTQTPGTDRCSSAWRPDLGRYELATPSGVCDFADGPLARALTQQVNGSLVVGWTVDTAGGGFARHAALWRVPAPNRAAFPKVDASPLTFASRISLARTGGLYHQFYRATQSAAVGPYLELVDWGDGTSSRRTRSSSVGGKIFYQTHTYTKRGTYWVRVYVKDARDRWGVDERRLTVTN
jgi:hypothetical protein